MRFHEMILHIEEEDEGIWGTIWLVNGMFHDRFLVQNLAVCVRVCCGVQACLGASLT
jgi:hypothetical protein